MLNRRVQGGRQLFRRQESEGQKPSTGGVTWDWDELFEAWCEEYPPDLFFKQTARTYIAAMGARAKVAKRQAERDLVLAYNTGAFSRASKVKPLSHYMRQLRGSEGRSNAADALSFFRSMKAKGIPVSITRVPREVH